MLADKDLRTLEEAGITNIETLASAAAAFLRAHPIYSVQPMPNALSVQEEAFLLRAGAAGVRVYNQRSAAENVTIVAGEYAQMVATASSQQEAAGRLSVSTSRIWQRISHYIDGVAGAVESAGALSHETSGIDEGERFESIARRVVFRGIRVIEGVVARPPRSA